MPCYGCNDTGHLYEVCLICRRLQETPSISTSTSWVDIETRRMEDTLQVCEDRERRAQHSRQSELVEQDYKEHQALHQPDRRPGPIDNSVHIDLTMQAMRYNMEPPSLPVYPTLAPESIVEVLV